LVSHSRYYYAESNLIMVSPFICNEADPFPQIFSKSPTAADGAFEEEKVIVCLVMPHLKGPHDKIVPREGLCITCYLLSTQGKTCEMIKASRVEDTVEPFCYRHLGQSKVSILERSLYWRGHYDDVTFKSPLTV